MKRVRRAIVFPWLFLSFLAFAEAPLIKPQTQGEVSFVSGGVGGDERAAMQAMRADYNLSLLFSVAGTGEYLSDVKVSIKDANGNNFLDTVSDGPMLFARLKAGRYLVSADNNGQVIHKTATVKGRRLTSLAFVWPREQGD